MEENSKDPRIINQIINKLVKKNQNADALSKINSDYFKIWNRYFLDKSYPNILSFVKLTKK